MAMKRLFPNAKLTALSKVNLTKKSRIMDVGCGSGSLLYALKEVGFTNLMGIDPYLKDNICYENGLNILKQTIHDLQDEYDLIMYHHSFEHIADPYHELESVSRRLAPGGVCMIRIPTVSSFAWERYREHWYQIDAPRHYFLHSVESMALLAGRAGFHLQKPVYDSTVDQFRGSELYARGIPFMSGEVKHLFTNAQIRAWKREAGKLNRAGRGDQAVFYLVKD
jgi:SAM-dependent methyltransferase